MKKIEELKANGFQELSKITPEQVTNGSLVVLYNKNTDEFEGVIVEAIERGPESYKLYFHSEDRQQHTSMISSDLESYYYRVILK